MGFNKRSFAEWEQQVSTSFKESEGFVNKFKNALKTAFTVPVEKNNDWIKNSLGEIINKENIDSFIPELVKEDASDLAQKIREQAIAVANATDGWDDYFAELKNNKQDYIVDLIKNTDGLSKLTGEDLVKANQQARSSAIAHNEAIKAQTFSAKAGKVALQAFATAGNMLAMWAITKGVELAVKGIDNLIHSAEHCKERVDELMSSYQSAINKANSNAKTIEELASRYEELSNGVNNLGENVSLSTDEYVEYNKIVNQIADMFPTMIQGYTNEGNAILSLKGNVEQLRNAYKEAQQEAYNLLISTGKDSSGNDIIKNYNNQVNSKYNFAGIRDESGSKDIIKILTTLTGALTPEEFREAWSQLHKEYESIWGTDKKINDALNLSGFSSLMSFDNYATMTSDDLAKAKQSARAIIQTYQAEIDSALGGVKLLANAYLMTNEDYADLSDQYKNAASVMVNSLSSELADGFENQIAVGSYVDGIVAAIRDNSDVQNAVTNLFSIDTSNMSISDAKSCIDEYTKIIADAIGENQLELKVRLGFEDIDNINTRLQNSIRKLTEDHGVIDRDTYSYLINEVDFKNFTHEQAEVWLNATLGATDATDAVTKYNEALKSTIEDGGIKTFSQAWSDLFTSEDEDIKKLSETLLDLAEKGRLTTEAFDQADSEAGDYFKNLGISSEEAISKINKLVDESSQLSSMSKQLSSITDALGTKRDTGFVNADTLSGFVEEIRGLDSWDHFQEVLGSTASSYGECQEAANALATEWVNSSDFLAQLTEQNEKYYAAQLKAMGIENYEEIIAYAHLAQKQMWNLALAKQAASDDSLNTADDCQRLLDLAQNAGVTGNTISMLTELMGIYNNLSHGIYGTNADALNEITTRAESIKQNVLNLLSNYSSDTVEPKPRIKLSPRAKETAGSAGRSAAESFKDALDKGLAALDKNLAAGYIVFNDYIQARLALIEDYYGQGKLSADEYYSYLEKHYDTQLSYMDQVVNAVTRRVDTELDALKQQKEDLENFYKVQIDSLEKQKTLLEEANQERQRQKDLQKSLYDMERARNQRTQMVYTKGRGMHYAADDQAIRDAQENVDNARYDMQIAEIEKSVSKLEAARDRETGIIDKKISDLEAYRDAWSDVTSAYTEEQENLIAAQILGADWETDILNGRIGILDAFKNQYIGIQQAMADAAWQSANEQMKAAKEAEKGASGSQSEAYFDNHGHAAIVTEPTLTPMEGGKVITPVQPGSLMWDLREKFDAYISKSSGDISSLMAPVNPVQNDMARRADSIGTVNNITNPGMRQVTIGDIHVTCPGVTSQEVARQVGVELNKQFSGLSLAALQESKKI